MNARDLSALTLTVLLALTGTVLIGTGALAQTATPSAATPSSADPAMTDHKDGSMKDGAMKDGTMKDGAMKDGAMMGQHGEFRSLAAPTQGKVSWAKVGEKYVLSITGLKTEAAPDLKVWLYQGDVLKDSTKLKVPGKYIAIGTLKKFSGDSKFTVSARALGKNMAKFNTVVLWCDQVSTAFASAALK
jgi:Electron transfer DM13